MRSKTGIIHITDARGRQKLVVREWYGAPEEIKTILRRAMRSFRASATKDAGTFAAVICAAGKRRGAASFSVRCPCKACGEGIERIRHRWRYTIEMNARKGPPQLVVLENCDTDEPAQLFHAPLAAFLVKRADREEYGGQPVDHRIGNRILRRISRLAPADPDHEARVVMAIRKKPLVSGKPFLRKDHYQPVPDIAPHLAAQRKAKRKTKS